MCRRGSALKGARPRRKRQSLMILISSVAIVPSSSIQSVIGLMSQASL